MSFCLLEHGRAQRAKFILLALFSGFCTQSAKERKLEAVGNIGAVAHGVIQKKDGQADAK